MFLPNAQMTEIPLVCLWEGPLLIYLGCDAISSDSLSSELFHFML